MAAALPREWHVSRRGGRAGNAEFLNRPAALDFVTSSWADVQGNISFFNNPFSKKSGFNPGFRSIDGLFNHLREQGGMFLMLERVNTAWIFVAGIIHHMTHAKGLHPVGRTGQEQFAKAAGIGQTQI
jgi:hypothetical protein